MEKTKVLNFTPQYLSLKTGFIDDSPPGGRAPRFHRHCSNKTFVQIRLRFCSTHIDMHDSVHEWQDLCSGSHAHTRGMGLLFVVARCCWLLFGRAAALTGGRLLCGGSCSLLGLGLGGTDFHEVPSKRSMLQ